MPKTLPNGLEVINVTPHELIFWDASWSGPVTVHSDVVINATPSTRILRTHHDPTFYAITTISYRENPEGRQTLNRLKERYPKALFIGSIITAQAYAEVYAPIPHSRGRKNPGNRLLKPNRFTTYQQKEEFHHGKEILTR